MAARERGSAARARSNLRPVGVETPRPASGPPQLLYLLVPVGAAVIVFAGAFGQGLVWDDPMVFEQLRAMNGIGDLLVPPDVVPKFYYRPLIFATFLVDGVLGGDSPFWFHATVILWHALVTALVFLLGRSLLGPERALEAALGALLFAVHPVHVESVAWIAGRSDVIATALILGTVLVAARVERSWTGWAAAGIFLLALLAKEISIAALVLVPSRDWLVKRRLYPTRYLPLLLAACVYFALRYNFLSALAGGLPVASPPGELVRHLIGAFGWYVSTALFPVNLNAYVPEVPPGPVYPLIGLAALVAMLWGGLQAWRGRSPIVNYALVWFMVTLAPSLVVIVRRSASAVLADRYLYLPSVGLALLVAWLVGAVRARRLVRDRAALAVFAAVTVLAGWQSVLRTEVWADNLSFWTDTAAKTPDDALPHRELGTAYMERNQLDEAEQSFRWALQLRSDPEGKVMTYGNLGNLYFRTGRLEEAEKAYGAGLAIYRHHHLLNGLGRIAMRRAEQAQARADQQEVVRQVLMARDHLQNAVAIEPRDYRSHVLLGQVLFSLGQRDAAREHLETALRIEPSGAVADTARQFLRQLGS